MAATALPVLIAGGGIGGLTLGQALRRRGIPFVVLEQAGALTEIGAALSLWPNALRALARLDLDGAVRAAGERITRAEVRTARGRRLMALDVAALEEELGAPTVALHRAALQRVLLQGLPAESLRLGARVASFADAPAGVTAILTSGERVTGSVLVGADGFRSAVRSALHGEEPPRYAGYTSWRAIVEVGVQDGAEDGTDRVPAGLAVEAWGTGARCGMIRVGPTHVYVFATVNAPEGRRDADEVGFLRRHFAGWAPPWPALLALLPPGALLHHDIFDRPARRPWGRGRVTLLGDAAHPMTPNLGQGGCTAIEDALVLADRLADSRDPAGALRAYEAARYERTEHVVRRARWVGRVGQERFAVLCALRNLLVRARSRRSTHRELLSYVDHRTDASA